MTTSTLALHGVHTDLLVQHYADRILVLVTQMGRVGSLIQASIPPTTDLQADPRELHPAIQLTPLFGSAPSAHMHTLYSLYASQIAILAWQAVGRERSVVVGMALKTNGPTEEQETFHAVMDALQSMF